MLQLRHSFSVLGTSVKMSLFCKLVPMGCMLYTYSWKELIVQTSTTNCIACHLTVRMCCYVASVAVCMHDHDCLLQQIRNILSPIADKTAHNKWKVRSLPIRDYFM